MKIQTSRFGSIEVEPDSIIEIPEGVIGFPKQERYVIIRHKQDTPFFWFQAMDDSDLAFVIVDPLVFKPDYSVPFSEHLLETMQASSPEELDIFVIVTIPQGNPHGMTANLLGPIVINPVFRLAKQLVLDERHFSHRHPILESQPRQDPEEQGHHSS